MLKIRLSRVGRKHVAKYRVVLTDHRESAKHGFIKILGSYDPHTKSLIMDMDEAAGYIKNGAQYSDTLAKIVANKKSLIENHKSVYVEKNQAIVPINKKNNPFILEAKNINLDKMLFLIATNEIA